MAGTHRNWKNFAQYFVQKEEEITKKEMGEEGGGGGGGGVEESRPLPEVLVVLCRNDSLLKILLTMY